MIYTSKYNINLLVHITFYYHVDREKYLLKVLENFNDYQLNQIHIVIDTNIREKTEKILEKNTNTNNHTIEIHAHENLDHPYNLTWSHREDMLKQIENYDIFLYLEDDILIPWENFQYWLEENQAIVEYGYLRGFLRVENSEDNTLYSVDFTEITIDPEIIEIAGKNYFQPQYPYHACWLYDRQQMRQFINLPAWQDGNYQLWGIRERAAAGMIWSAVDGKNHRIVLPLLSNSTIEPRALNYHLSNNYYNNLDSPHGKIPLNQLLSFSRPQPDNLSATD